MRDAGSASYVRWRANTQLPGASFQGGAIPGTLDSLPGYLLDTAHDSDPWAYAEVACSGRVFVDLRGIRAERAEVLRIALVEEAGAVKPHYIRRRAG